MDLTGQCVLDSAINVGNVADILTFMITF